MKSFVALSALVLLAVCVVSSQGKSFGNKNVNKNVNDNSNSDFDFLSSFLDSYLSQQEKKGKAAKAVPASVPIASKSAVTTSTAINDESPASIIAVAISRSLPDTSTTAQQQQEDQQSFQVEIGLDDNEFVDDISAFDDSEQEESPFSAAQLKFFQSLMEA
ncbi:hypothetical protein DAPPUDRAFT_304014 [Daphnia pulex]|uniref:Uncharacterized protein n=1 Tax=Daphnia pulex TaxID=6669 RepID=E9GJ50_DAPPU|nr:hypothetical protein DAPPUDRAFT_304014 [Daphnia pulex]|eukprot:EFX80546.1 hypothetical protein DAPPUDRAFT_304014 [Daphnia pulex]